MIKEMRVLIENRNEARHLLADNRQFRHKQVEQKCNSNHASRERNAEDMLKDCNRLQR